MASLDAIFDGVIEEGLERPPIAVLKELAQGLEKRTKGLLVGRVEQFFSDPDFSLQFYITAPSLNNYSYEVFSVTHDLSFYPLHIWWTVSQTSRIAGNQEDFEKELKTIFSSPEVKKVINGLLAQIQSSN
jgi:hypothetical protein